MKIYYELTHTGCDREIMRSGFDFDVLHPEWNEEDRPQPKNSRLIQAAEGPYDVSVVGTPHGLRLAPKGVPLIWKSFTDFGKWPKPNLEKIAAWVAPCAETVARWDLEGDPKAVVIEHGIDMDVFKGYSGKKKRVMTVANKIGERPEKGPDVLNAVNKLVDVDLYGFGNKDFVGNKGFRGFRLIADMYRAYRVYFNPSTVTVCAVLEAMATGMPVVTYPPGNFVSMMKDRENCFIVSTPQEAANAIELCLRNKGLSRDIGQKGRESVMHRFHPGICAHRWRKLIENVAAGKTPPCDFV
jgi:glycosyltransferase involved in cell wall biosynthesis